MVGSILISGRRTGQVRLDLIGDKKTGIPEQIDFVPTNPNATFEDVCLDAQQKLDSIKASPSPVQSEIDFLETWLKLSLTPTAASLDQIDKIAEEAQNEKPSIVTRIFGS